MNKIPSITSIEQTKVEGQDQATVALSAPPLALPVDFVELTPRSLLRNLPLFSETIPFDLIGRQVAERFKQQPTLPGLILAQEDRLYGVISRRYFFEKVAQRFGIEIFFKRPIWEFLETYPMQALALPHDCPIIDAARTAFSRPHEQAYEPIVIKFPDDTAKLLDAFTLLQAQSHLVILAERQIQQHRYEIEKRLAVEEQIRRQNDELEQRVMEGTAKLQETHSLLLEASRHAGMAEVATDVLHNVGNALNGINVATALLAEKVEHSEIANLQKLTDLIRQHSDQLAVFLTQDPQGRHVIPYLDKVSQLLAKDQAEFKDRLATLCTYVEHIRAIIETQQSYARIGGVEVETDVNPLVEDAVKINLAGLQRHGVKLRREFCELPLLRIDKHRVLQILVNLINNAKYALSNGENQIKFITVRTQIVFGRLHVEVEDNGVGITEENLTRIFQHGFTTKKNGHGFGLHSGALAAKEMGGKLSVRSDGPGRGAVFTLDLPFKPVEKICSEPQPLETTSHTGR